MKNILLIEDDEAIAELEKDYLEAADFKVRVEHQGLQGLNTALSQPIDLIVLDLMLPGMSGVEICQQLREKKDIPVLIVSARTEDQDKIALLGLGADDYITKPFSPAELVARVQAHLNRYDRLTQSGLSTDKIEYFDIKVDNSARRVWLKNNDINLTAKEYDLLYLFLTHPGIVFSKEDIYHRLWSVNFGDMSTVTVHMRKLREKLQDTGEDPKYIKTLWGVGYRLDL